MDKVIINVNGMNDVHEQNSVTEAIFELRGVEDVRVEENSKSVVVEYDSGKISNKDIKSAIIAKGYGIIEEKTIYK